MDASFHPWTKYEIVRLRDEERLLRARDAMRVREFRESQRDGEATTARAGSWLGRLRRRQPVADGATVRARPV